MTSPPASLLAIQVGNTRIRLARFDGRELVGEAVAMPVADIRGAASSAGALAPDHAVVPVLSSVNEPAAERLERALADAGFEDVLRIGRDVPLAMRHALDDDSTLGQDRLVCAIAAYTRTKQACVVVDAGTAITCDFVDGEGTFQGGVIAPGLNMMLRSLHEHTAALPAFEFAPPDPARGVFGKDTRHAMTLGVLGAARGLVRHVVELFAVHYEAYPQIVATGGDAEALFAGDELVEHIVPDLQLLGVAEAYHAAMELDDDGEEPDDD